MEILGSFIISLAAGHVLNKLNLKLNSVEGQLKNAFDSSLQKFSKNQKVRELDKKEFSKKLDEYYESPEFHSKAEPTDSALKRFLDLFAMEIIKHELAYQYLKSLKDQANFDFIKKQLDSQSYVINNLSNKFDEMNLNNIEAWKKNLDLAEELLSKFKAETAMDLIKKLEESIRETEIQPTEKLRSRLHCLKGDCHYLLGNTDERNKEFIRAYKLNPTDLKYMEKACTSYINLNDTVNSEKIIEKLLSLDDYNPVANACKLKLASKDEFKTNFEKLPHIVTNNLVFKRLSYHYILSKFDNLESIELLKKYDISLNPDNYIDKKLVYADFKEWGFVISTLVSEFMRNLGLSANSIFTGDEDLLKTTYKVLNNYIESLKVSETPIVTETLQFIYSYTKLAYLKEDEALDEMQTLYTSSEGIEESYSSLLINSLFVKKRYEDVIQISELTEPTVINIQLKANAELALNNSENYIKTNKTFFELLQYIDIHTTGNVLNNIRNLRSLEALQDVNHEQLLLKTFEFESLKTFVSLNIEVYTSAPENSIIHSIQSLETELITLNNLFHFDLAYLYYTLKDYKNAIRHFRAFIESNKDPHVYYFYIRCLIDFGNDNEELLKQLKHWRKTFKFNEEFLLLEAELRKELLDWEECREICKVALEKIPGHESFIVLHLHVIAQLEGKEKLLNAFKKIDTQILYNFRFYGHIRNINSTLLRNQFFDEVFELTYQYARKEENLGAKQDYINLLSHLPKRLFVQPKHIEYGVFVEFENSPDKFNLINNRTSGYEGFLGKKVGDTIEITAPFSFQKKSFKIKTIVDKHFVLQREIFKEIATNPMHGMPFEMHKFEDLSPAGMKKTFSNLFGAQNDLLKEQQNKLIRKYYNYELSLFEIIAQVYNSNFILGYHELVNYREGINIIPISNFKEILDNKNTNFLLDYSSLLILYKTHNKHKFEINNKFKIPKTLKANLKHKLDELLLEKPEKASLDISLSNVVLHKEPKEWHENNVVYLEGIIAWVEENCEEIVSVKKLDLLKELRDKINSEHLANYGLDVLSILMDNEDLVLISDDYLFYKILSPASGRILSSEAFLYSYENDVLFSELRTSNYVGVRVNSGYLLEQYMFRCAGKPNNFDLSLRNLSIVLLPLEETFHVAIDFLKKICLEPVFTEEQLCRVSSQVFMNMFQGVNNKKSILFTKQLIGSELRYLLKDGLVINELDKVLSVLNS